MRNNGCLVNPVLWCTNAITAPLRPSRRFLPLLLLIVVASANLPVRANVLSDKNDLPKQNVADSQAVQKLVALIDEKLAAKWQKDGVKPAPEIDDALFLRRVSLDLLGRIQALPRFMRFWMIPAPTNERT